MTETMKSIIRRRKMEAYRNTITGEIWDREEIEKEYNDFREESEYMKGFSTFVDYFEDQISKGDLIPARWYAVQKDSSDPWDNGSYDRNEAVEMLKEQGCGLIAVIINDYCEREITYEEVTE